MRLAEWVGGAWGRCVIARGQTQTLSEQPP